MVVEGSEESVVDYARQQPYFACLNQPALEVLQWNMVMTLSAEEFENDGFIDHEAVAAKNLLPSVMAKLALRDLQWHARQFEGARERRLRHET